MLILFSVSLAFRRFWPEIILAVTVLFFAFRELGTFPAVWSDDALYMIVAKTLASGHGYALPVLDDWWYFPNLLSVGPAMIVPVGIMIKLFGFSVLVARIVPTMYLLGTCAVFYMFCRQVAGRESACWSTALLVTLSAFVNTGKPVLGSVPAFFYLMLGLVLVHRRTYSIPSALLTSLAFGLSFLSKVTYLITIPGLLLAAIVAWRRGNHRKMRYYLLVIGISCAFVAPFYVLETHYSLGFMDFFQDLVSTSFAPTLMSTLGEKVHLLIRFQYLYFITLLFLGMIGIAVVKDRMLLSIRLLIVSMILFFLLHFLLREGWYRHLLPAHLLLLPFVPLGAFAILPRRFASAMLLFFIGAQFFWQLDHRGSPTDMNAVHAAALLTQQYADTPLLIRSNELYVFLPDNPHWLFYPPIVKKHVAGFEDNVPLAMRCLPRVREVRGDEREELAGRLKPLYSSFAIIQPNQECIWPSK